MTTIIARIFFGADNASSSDHPLFSHFLLKGIRIFPFRQETIHYRCNTIAFASWADRAILAVKGFPLIATHYHRYDGTPHEQPNDYLLHTHHLIVNLWE